MGSDLYTKDEKNMYRGKRNFGLKIKIKDIKEILHFSVYDFIFIDNDFLPDNKSIFRGDQFSFDTVSTIRFRPHHCNFTKNKS